MVRSFWLVSSQRFRLDPHQRCALTLGESLAAIRTEETVK
jgi:hypothetical protein